MNDSLRFFKGLLIAIPVSILLWGAIFTLLITIYNWVVAAIGTT